MRTVTASMPKALVEELDAIAQREERSRSKVIEMILRRELESLKTFRSASLGPPQKKKNEDSA